jgi:hypothetical protein
VAKIRRLSACLVVLTVTTALVVLGTSVANAVPPRAHPAPAARHYGGGLATTLTFTPAAQSGLSRSAVLSCGVSFPFVLFQWGSPNAFAFGSSYNGNFQG